MKSKLDSNLFCGLSSGAVGVRFDLARGGANSAAGARGARRRRLWVRAGRAREKRHGHTARVPRCGRLAPKEEGGRAFA